MGASPILEHAEDAKTPHRILVRSLLTSRNKLRAKYRKLQKDCKRLRNQVAAVERSRDMREETGRARKRDGDARGNGTGPILLSQATFLLAHIANNGPVPLSPRRPAFSPLDRSHPLPRSM